MSGPNIVMLSSGDPATHPKTLSLLTIQGASKSTASASSSTLNGLSGFINDFRTLSREVDHLKASQNTLTEMLKEKQIVLNKVSEEWCTLQAQLAKNEMLIKAQQTQIVSLKRQAESIKIQNKVWDSKLSSVGKGLQTLFHSSMELQIENHDDIDDDDVGDSQLLQLQKRQKVHVPENVSTFGKNSVCHRDEFVCLQQKFLDANSKLETLRENLFKKMTNKEQSQRELKADLMEKNEALQKISRLLLKHNSDKTGLQQQKESETKKTDGDKRLLRARKGKKITSTSGNTQHARDFSIPIQKGYACTCGEQFNLLPTLHRHLGTINSLTKKFICDFCNRAFIYFSPLSRHLKECHEREFPPNTHGCRTCGAVFPNKTELMRGWKHRNGNCILKKRVSTNKN